MGEAQIRSGSGAGDAGEHEGARFGVARGGEGVFEGVVEDLGIDDGGGVEADGEGFIDLGFAGEDSGGEDLADGGGGVVGGDVARGFEVAEFCEGGIAGGGFGVGGDLACGG